MDWPMKIQRRVSNEGKKPQKKSPSPKPDKKSSLHATAGNEAFTLKIRIESPPLVAFGPPEDSSGALLSGILDLYPNTPANATADRTFDVEKLEMKFIMEVTTRRPIGHNCPACATRSRVFHTWTLIPTRMTLQYNNGAAHGFPFSFLVPGHLPATTRTSLAVVSYKLVAEAIPVPPCTTSTSISGPPSSPKQTDSFKPVILSQSLQISRSILPSIEPKHSQRIFPPTTLQSMLTLPTVIYPGSTDNEVDVTLSGLNIKQPGKLRWSLRKISWRIDELAKVVSPACASHSAKVGGVEGKGIMYEDKRIVGAGEMKSGWKHDPSAGKIEIVLHIGTAPSAMAACHVDAKCGVYVSHTLIIECVVAEEMHHAAIGPARKGGQYLPTGNARVLRMSFPILVTERGGMGISWDEEIPPRYEDVAWNAPPTFAQSERSADAEHRDSMEEIEALEGIRRPRSESPAVYGQRPASAGSFFGTRLARTDSDTSTASN